MKMKVYNHQIVLQEVPNEISLSFAVAGCPLNCIDCNWKEFISTMPKKELGDDEYLGLLQANKGLATCVLFLGGEWVKDDLGHKLKQARSYGFKTCLYTGLEDVDNDIKTHLTYLKTGPYIKERGTLENPKTNQKFYDLRTGEILNRYFWKTDPLERNKKEANGIALK